jgi:membrane protein implicated in regulation of membrane protease activity
VRKSVKSSLLVVTLLAIWVCALAAAYTVVFGLEAFSTGSGMGWPLFVSGTLATLAYVVARLAHAARNRGEQKPAHRGP